MKVERPETLTVARGVLPLGWGQENSQSWSLLFLVFAMARNAVIGEVLDGGWYGVHAMDGSRSLRE